MKQRILLVTSTLALLLVALYGISGDAPIRADNKGNQNDAKKTEPPKVVYDIAGKRLRADEKYIAERTFTNGRIIAYRKNKREVAALVKALKEDGVTDKKLLDPQTWLMNICQKTCCDDPPCQGGCGIGHTCQGSSMGIERQAHHVNGIHFCICVP
jgi:hypothetical protein